MGEHAAGLPKFTNRLAQETSPYLLQHAHNPVDWHPWGPEAFARARREDKPIFLSVGYSTCYWCHVMERQSFENEQIASEMNRLFVNIKVDREERPDVDQLYMTAVQVLTHHGGWPMSVFLTPDLKPFYGGTYFPPADQHGRPGFVTILRAIEDAYRNRRGDVDKTCAQLTDILHQLAEPAAPEQDVRFDWALVDSLVDRSTSDYEPTFGGFGSAPKFPRETLLELLLVYLRERPDGDQRIKQRKSQLMKQLRHALDAMADGGIRDHLGGGFHRYSTDAKWLVPHFEIMLYDNALLASAYVEAFDQTGHDRYALVARGICDFVLREMTSPDGAFYTAFDAEVDAMEGASYLWTTQQVQEVLGAQDGAIFSHAYGLDLGPNFEDPHHGAGRPDKNILYLPNPISADEETRLAPLRQKLYDARRQRKQPLLDTKIITSWNGLMIRAMTFAGNVLVEPRYTQAAQKAARFLLDHHRTSNGGLFRTSREGKTRHDGFLDDYAFLAQALLELGWRDEASALAKEMASRFGDASRGGFYFTSDSSEQLLVRQKVASDSPLPSGNAIAAMVELQLGRSEACHGVLAAFARQIEGQGEGMSSMVQAAALYLKQQPEFTVKAIAASSNRPANPEELAAAAVDLDAAWQSPRELHIRMTIAKGYHVNANPAGPGLVPTGLSIAGRQASVEYPAAHEQAFAFSEQKIPVYSEEAILIARFPIDMTGQGVVRLALTYQPCNESACLPAITQQFELNTP